ncbi:BA75_00399T0 [Komagataella pastoris]|uniref:BA75_00399T0 n=1 Tax=Komagataella pastoris TaxID=4922 RepID=A0A1B2J7F3_PICPA|nr:BA75_00399T0 [Komagataella pastoris]
MVSLRNAFGFFDLEMLLKHFERSSTLHSLFSMVTKAMILMIPYLLHIYGNEAIVKIGQFQQFNTGHTEYFSTLPQILSVCTTMTIGLISLICLTTFHGLCQIENLKKNTKVISMLLRQLLDWE